MRALAGLALIALAACGEGELGEPVYPLESCGFATIEDRDQRAYVGIEDIAYHEELDLLLFSAYDRRNPEYEPASIPWASRDVLTASSSAQAEDLFENWKDDQPGLPHGIAIKPGADPLNETSLAYISRTIEDGELEQAEIVRYRLAAPLGLATLAGEADRVTVERNANDLIFFGDDQILYTVDRAEPVWLQNIFGLRSGSLMSLTDGRVAKVVGGLSFANGLLRKGDRIYVAETRGRSLAVVDPDAKAVVARIRAPGGPDNLTLNAEGQIVAALHPNLLKLGMHRKLGAKYAPSRAVRIHPETGAWTLLFDDPTGEVFTGATVAAEIDGKLVLGSATDRGLLVCDPARPEKGA